MRANRVLAEEAATEAGQKRGARSGPKGLKCYKGDEAMADCSKRMEAELVLGIGPQRNPVSS